MLGPCRRAAVRAVVQLVGHLAVFDDRPDDQLREEKHIHCKRDEVFLRRDLSGADIDLIADDLENVVADAQRQHRADVQRRQPQMRDLVDRVDQEVGILEVHQHAQIDEHRCQRQQTAQFGLCPRCQQRPQVVKDDQHGDQRQERNTCPAVEDEAFCQQHCIFGAARHQIIQQQRKRQEAEQEHHTVKNHGGLPFFR